MHNPLNIYTGDSIETKYHRLSDSRKFFINDMSVNYSFQVTNYNNPTLDDAVIMIENYAIDMMIEYKTKNFHTLPITIVEDVLNQIKESAQILFTFCKDNPHFLNRIEVEIRQKICNPVIEQYIQLYFLYFIDTKNSSNKNVVRIASTFINQFIENFERDNTIISEKYLITNVKNSFKFEPSKDEISEAFNLINILYGDDKRLINKKSTFQFGILIPVAIYESLFSKFELINILKSLSKII